MQPVSRMTSNLGKGYSTHNALLLRVLDASDGDVVEMGSGPFSTALLHWYCKNKKRKLITYEDDPQYYIFAKMFQSPEHRVIFIEDWDKVDTSQHRGLVFIDHGGKLDGGYHGSRRGLDVTRWKDTADYIVMHDTEVGDYVKDDIYNYRPMWKNFKYKFTWKECRPWTSVVSNSKDVSGWI
jgi:hypothetical protein